MQQDQDLALARLLVARRAIAATDLQRLIGEARNASLPLGRYAAQTACVDRPALLSSLRELNGGIDGPQGLAAVQDALMASLLIASGQADPAAVEQARTTAFQQGRRLGDTLAQQGLVTADVCASSYSHIQATTTICPACFGNFEQAWLQSVSASACPMCLEPWQGQPAPAPQQPGASAAMSGPNAAELAATQPRLATFEADEPAPSDDTFQGLDLNLGDPTSISAQSAPSAPVAETEGATVMLSNNAPDGTPALYDDAGQTDDLLQAERKPIASPPERRRSSRRSPVMAQAPRRRRRLGMSGDLISPDMGWKGYLPFIALGLAGASGLIVLAAILLAGSNEEGIALLKDARREKANGNLEKAVTLYNQALDHLGGSEADEAARERDDSQKIATASEDAITSVNVEAAMVLVNYALTGTDEVLRIRALNDLAVAKIRAVTGELTPLADAEAASPQVRKAAVRAIVMTGGRNAIPYLGQAIVEDLIRDKDGAFKELIRARGPEAIGAIIELLEAGGSTLSVERVTTSCRRLGTLRAKAAKDVLRDIVNSSHPDVARAEALRALGKVAPNESVDTFISALFEDEGEKTSEAALDGLVRAEDAAVNELEKRLLQKDILAAVALVRITTTASAQALEKALLQGDWTVRRETLTQVVEAKFPKNLLREAVAQTLKDATTSEKSRNFYPLDLVPLIEAADYFNLPERMNDLLSLQLYLESEGQKADNKIDLDQLKEVRLPAGSSSEVGANNGTVDPIRVAFVALDGTDQVGFKLEPGEKQRAQVSPGRYRVVLDRRTGGKAREMALETADIVVRPGSLSDLRLGIAGIDDDDD